MSKYFKAKLVVLIAVIVPLICQAQPLKLSFQDAWEMAQSENAAMQQADLNIDRANAQIGEAYSAAMPTLTVSGYYQRNFVIPEMVTEMPEEFGGGTMSFKFEKENLFNGKIELAQPIYVAGKVGMALKIAQLYRQVSEEQLSQTRTETKLLITQLYFGASVAHEWENVVQESYNQMAAHLEKVEDMNQEGIVSEYDLIRSRVQVSNFYPQVIGAATTRKVAFEALAIALNLPRNQEIVLTDNLLDFPLQPSEVENPFEIALQNRPELRQLDLQERMLGTLLKIEKHGIYWPNLFLVGGYTASAQEPDFDYDDYYWMESLYARLSLSIPLFDGFKAHHRAQQVRVDLKTANLQRDQLQRGINLELIQAESRLAEALKNVSAQEEGRELAQKGYSIAEVRYENGLATQLELMDAQVALNQARNNLLSARYDAITAKAALDKAIGRD